MPDGEAQADRAFRRRLANRLTELRLAVDLGEITTREAFQAMLERDREFTVGDPRVREACVAADLGDWIT